MSETRTREPILLRNLEDFALPRGCETNPSPEKPPALLASQNYLCSLVLVEFRLLRGKAEFVCNFYRFFASIFIGMNRVCQTAFSAGLGGVRRYNKVAFDKLVAAKLEKNAGPTSIKALTTARRTIESKSTESLGKISFFVKMQLDLEKSSDGKQFQTVSDDIRLVHALPVEKKDRILFLSLSSSKQELAESLGASLVGGAEKIPLIVDESISFDKLLCTRDIFPQIVKIAKILGPRGIMPSPGKGTVSDDVSGMLQSTQSVTKFQSNPENATVIQRLGQMDWSDEHIMDNTRLFIDKVTRASIKLKGNAKKSSAILKGLHFEFSRPSNSAVKEMWFSIRVNTKEFFVEKPKQKLSFKQMLQAHNLLST